MQDPVFITALRNDAAAITPEAEGVLFDVTAGLVRQTLDDGSTLTFHADEFREVAKQVLRNDSDALDQAA